MGDMYDDVSLVFDLHRDFSQPHFFRGRDYVAT